MLWGVMGALLQRQPWRSESPASRLPFGVASAGLDPDAPLREAAGTEAMQESAPRGGGIPRLHSLLDATLPVGSTIGGS